MSTSVILREGQYVVDQQYPVALVLEMFSLWLILGNTQQWVNFRAKLRHHLFKAFLLFELFILIQICIGFAVNESKNTANYPNIRNHRNNMVYAALAFHVISKLLFGAMLIYRCFAIILDRKIKYVVLTIAFCIVVSVCTLISVVAYKHVEMFRLISVRDFKSLTGVIHYMTQLNLAQIVLYTAVTVSTTGLIFQYVGRCLMNNKGYYEYLRSCRSSRMAVIFILDQLFNLIFTAMVSSSRYQIRRSYFHYQNFSLSLAAYFFYWTFEDIKNAVRQTGMASKSMPSVPNETGNQDDSELPASAKVNKQNDSRNKV